MARKPGEDLQNPDFSGEKGRAWDLSGLRREGIDITKTAALGGWLIEAIEAHPLWNYHLATLIHLRDIPGVPPANKKRPGATHQFVMLALNPDTENQIDLEDASTLHPLRDPDVVDELVIPHDERAIEVVKLAVQNCVDGVLIPDSDYRAEWVNFFRTQE